MLDRGLGAPRHLLRRAALSSDIRYKLSFTINIFYVCDYGLIFSFIFILNRRFVLLIVGYYVLLSCSPASCSPEASVPTFHLELKPSITWCSAEGEPAAVRSTSPHNPYLTHPYRTGLPNPARTTLTVQDQTPQSDKCD